MVFAVKLIWKVTRALEFYQCITVAFTDLFVPKVERVTKTMSEDKKEYDLKMQEYAQLLDIRADRIRVSIAIQLKRH